MLIALLAVLGVNLIVIVVLLAFVLSRKRWVKRQPGSFHGVIRASSGEIDGLGAKWGRGYGRWVRDVLVWTKAPFFFRNELVPADNLDQQRPARTDEVKRLGDHPIVMRLKVGNATVEVAAHDDQRDLLLGPFGKPADAAAARRARAREPRLTRPPTHARPEGIRRVRSHGPGRRTAGRDRRHRAGARRQRREAWKLDRPRRRRA